MGGDMEKLDYTKVRTFWDEEYGGPAFTYGQGWHITQEEFGRLRFEWEIKAYSEIFKLGERKNGSLLDVGCGNGKHSFFFSRYFDEVVGVDFSSNSIRIAQQEARLRKLDNVTFYSKDVATLNLHERFDVIFDGAVMPYLNKDDLALFFCTVFNHLKDGGVVLFRAPLFSRNKTLVKTGDYHIVYWPLRWIIGQIKSAGFEVLNVRVNHAYQYAVILDFYQKVLSKIIPSRKLVERIVYGILAKKYVMVPSSHLLRPLIKVKGYFILARKSAESHLSTVTVPSAG